MAKLGSAAQPGRSGTTATVRAVTSIAAGLGLAIRTGSAWGGSPGINSGSEPKRGSIVNSTGSSCVQR